MVVRHVHIPSLREFRRDTRLILIASGIFSVGLFGIQTLLKVLYVLRLGYGLEYIGLFTAASALTYMTMSMPSGALGTRFGLKPAMVFGGVLTTLGMLMLPMTEMMPASARDAWPIASQVVLMGGWSLISINMVPALMAATTNRTRDDAYALSSMLRGAGTFLGTAVGGMLPMIFVVLFGGTTDSPAPYRWSLLLATGFGFAGMIPLLRLRIERSEEVSIGTEAHSVFPLALVAVAALHTVLTNAAFATCQSFCSAYMDTDLGLSTASIGILTAVGQFVAILAPVAMPYFGERRSHAWTLMMVSALSAVVLVPLALIPTWWSAGLGRMGLLALAALWMPALQVFQMTVIEQHWRSLAYGAVSTAMGFSFGTMSLAGGFVAAGMGYSALFMLGGMTAAGGAAVMWTLRRHWLPLLARPELEESDLEEAVLHELADAQLSATMQRERESASRAAAGEA
ncbi:MAG: MFS transporter [Caldilineaceae bacterium]